MPIGFAIFITAVIVSVVVILIYHFVIIGTSSGTSSGGSGGGGYNYDANIAYLNTAMVAALQGYGGLDNYSTANYPPLPDGTPVFFADLSKP